MTGTIVWITGATSGIGAALAASVPYEAARVINISRSVNPATENVSADLADSAGWDAVERHLAQELSRFGGDRLLFVHNAFMADPPGFVGATDPVEYRRHIQANATAPLILGEAFLRLAPDGVDAGLVMISSAAARVPFAGRAGYGAGKAAIEQWVRAVRSELDHQRPSRPVSKWVVAIRPGAVDTPSLREYAELDPIDNPTAPATKAALVSGRVDTPELAAQRIWDVIAQGGGSPAVVLLGEMIAPPRPE
jgi:benzil reductase ((S)-benzoin forming)